MYYSISVLVEPIKRYNPFIVCILLRSGPVYVESLVCTILLFLWKTFDWLQENRIVNPLFMGKQIKLSGKFDSRGLNAGFLAPYADSVLSAQFTYQA